MVIPSPNHKRVWLPPWRRYQMLCLHPRLDASGFALVNTFLRWIMWLEGRNDRALPSGSPTAIVPGPLASPRRGVTEVLGVRVTGVVPVVKAD